MFGLSGLNRLLDVSVGGSRWSASASPSLSHLVRRTAEDIPHPTIPHKTLWDASSDEGPFEGLGDKEFMANYEAERLKRASTGTGIAALGSGSDYTVFLQRLGVGVSRVVFLCNCSHDHAGCKRRPRLRADGIGCGLALPFYL